jgi:nucleoside-diphosphate-sugar epimerase
MAGEDTDPARGGGRHRRYFTALRVLVTGSTGVLGRALLPLLAADGHAVQAPGHRELDLFSPAALSAAVRNAQGVFHLATRIPPRERIRDPDAWSENDRLRAVATRLAVDAALAAGVEVFVQPTVAFVYPEGPADEDTPIGRVPSFLESALAAEQEVARFAAAGRRGVVLRLGLLDGPGTGNDHPNPAYGSTLHVADAGRALHAALGAPSGIYNVTRDGERISNRRFRQATGWRPSR